MERTWVLAGGADGGVPTDENYRVALLDIASLEDVSIVAAPGARPIPRSRQAVNARADRPRLGAARLSHRRARHAAGADARARRAR